MATILETPRLRLRTWNHDARDAGFLLRLYGDPAVMRYLDAAPWTTTERAYLAIERAEAQQSARGYCIWAMEQREDDALVGACGLYWVEWEQLPEVAYHLVPSAWGRGYATEALVATLAYAHDVLKIARVMGVAEPEHATSRRVMEKAGMVDLGLGPFDAQVDLWRFESRARDEGAPGRF